jgi:hypothetical protein
MQNRAAADGGGAAHSPSFKPVILLRNPRFCLAFPLLSI